MPPTADHRAARRLRRPCPLPQVVAVLLSALLAAPASVAQAPDRSGPEMNAAAARESYEAIFATALDMPADTEPMQLVMTWSAVFESAVIADRLRQLESGQEPSNNQDAVVDAVLARLRSRRPDSPLPELLPLLQERDVEAKSRALLELASRFPDDPTVLEMTVQSLRQTGSDAQAAAVTESFLARHPADATAYDILVGLAGGNATHQAEILQRWARAAPGDPRLVEHWLQTDLPRLEPESTAALFAELLDHRPQGFPGLRACEGILQTGDLRYRDAARSCVARLAADAEQPEPVAQAASTALVRMAAAEGNWSGLARSLAGMDGESRYAAMMAAAHAIETPSGCGDLLALLAQALADLPDDGYDSVASALVDCDQRPEAQAMLLEVPAPCTPRPGGVGPPALGASRQRRVCQRDPSSRRRGAGGAARSRAGRCRPVARSGRRVPGGRARRPPLPAASTLV